MTSSSSVKRRKKHKPHPFSESTGEPSFMSGVQMEPSQQKILTWVERSRVSRGDCRSGHTSDDSNNSGKQREVLKLTTDYNLY